MLELLLKPELINADIILIVIMVGHTISAIAIVGLLLIDLIKRGE